MSSDHDLARKVYVNSLYAFLTRAFVHLNPGDEFVGGYYLRALCQMLTLVAEGKIRRLIITLPPRHGKSQAVSVAFPAWLLGRNPTEKIVCASYSSSLADDFGRQTRDLMTTPFYRATFPKTLIDPRKSAVEEFHTLAKGRRIATSVGGTLTGKGGRFLLFDDLMKAEDAESLVKRDSCHDWFRNTAASRLNDPRTGAIIIVAQRLHVDDLVGRLLPSGDWVHLNLPAIATETQVVTLGDSAEWTRCPGELLHPERFTTEILEERKRELGSKAFEAQYQQSPALPGGSLIKLEWFGTYEGAPKPDRYEAIAQSWDTASVPGIDNDYSVCTTWGLINDKVDLLDVHREQYHYADLLRAARTLRTKWQPKLIVVEKAGVGIALGNDLLRDGYNDVQALSPKGDKMQRLSLQAAKIEAGQVRLPKWAAWLDQFLTEMAEAPNGRYDDQLDSVSQMLRSLDTEIWQLRGISRYRR